MNAVYVASSAANAAFALDPTHVIEVCYYGVDPLGDAKSYAKDYTKAEERAAYVYKVTVEPVHKYNLHKEVVGSDHTF